METLKKIFFIVERLTRSKRFWFLIILLIFMLTSVGDKTMGNYPLSPSTEKKEYKLVRGTATSMNRLLMLPIHGIILDDKSSSNPITFFAQTYTFGSEVKSELERAEKDETVKGILLHINSPGGTVTGSKIISDAVQKYQKVTGKPVYAYISAQGLSGGYWSAASADYVIANEGSFVGSIGVILGPFKQYKQVISESEGSFSISTKENIETNYITAGKFKDTGNPYREMTEEEKKHWQSLVDDGYTMFTNHIAQRRAISTQQLKDNIKALPYDAQTGKDLRLIDLVGSEDEAIKELLRKAQLMSNDYQLIQPKVTFSVLSELLGAVSQAARPHARAACDLCGKPLFLYDPGLHYFQN